ncbi:class II fructose-bisphosphatase [Pelagibacterium xiamenense]|uniref:class II fructose-bisphosphatase n=1 Tax=Pelagibacterium xiamenense TaxID=2901140 RepID=UPI001E51AF78|nr:class II fructose-bisphosphatase [Pelagibacterium xiamenense]MCD7060846.1 class II fructose-bisphosphatase [Pelagibacterium xiamenense]
MSDARAQAPETEIVDRNLTLEIARITERAAIAAAGWRGKGDEMRADQAAVEAMHDALTRIDFKGKVVIGEMRGSEKLGLDEEVGTGRGPDIDVAVDPLEGVTGCAKDLPDALSVLAFAERGGLLHVPDAYMEKIAIGPGYPEGIVDLDKSPRENIETLAKAKGVPITEIVACVLDRPRHASLLAELREIGVAVKLLPDGDIAAVIHAANSDDTGIDIYMGSGGAPEGVLAAVAMRCIGGQMQGRLILDTAAKREQAERIGIPDLKAKYSAEDMAHGDVLFAATGVTKGSLLNGVKILPRKIVTSSVVMRSWSKTTRWITAEHQR